MEEKLNKVMRELNEMLDIEMLGYFGSYPDKSDDMARVLINLGLLSEDDYKTMKETREIFQKARIMERGNIHEWVDYRKYEKLIKETVGHFIKVLPHDWRTLHNPDEVIKYDIKRYIEMFQEFPKNRDKWYVIDLVIDKLDKEFLGLALANEHYAEKLKKRARKLAKASQI